MVIYTVKEGDTLSSIGAQYGISAERIAYDNSIDPELPLVVGQTLVLLFPVSVYTVTEGDTLFSIAEETGVGVYTLLQNNPVLMGMTEIYPGQTLVLSYPDAPLGDISLGGFAYTYIDEETLRRTLPYLTYLSVFSYGLNPDGTLVVPEGDERIVQIAREYGTVPLLVLTSLSSEGVFSSELINSILSDKALTATVIENVKNAVFSKGYGGVDMDFEYIAGELAANYAAFIDRLKNELGEGYVVFTDLAPKTSGDMQGLLYEAHDYGLLGSVSDRVFLMTYEWGYSYGPPLAISPVNNVRRVIEYALTEIPPEKIFMGIPAYGYDWKLPYVRGETRAKTLSSEEAVELAREVGADIQFDEVSKAPFFEYTDTDGAQHVVWFQDTKSVDALAHLAQEYSLYGISIWNIMRYFPQLWLVLNSLYNIRKV
ncbi:MAG: glycosyl hydrolase family 18 protein [Clostridia bacterium]|nr:glycosyl hydrolase family 18 protein [Clostridia bacterium]